MKTFGKLLEQFKGFGPGFDFARITLAFAVLTWHTPLLLKGDETFQNVPGLWVLHYSVLPMFFGLSGFLIAGSAQRLNLRNFLINRGLRILPALAVEITLSALVLGPIFTVFPLGKYFTSPSFFTYFLNITGWVHFHLPGVFLSNPHPNIINVSLWTVPFEMLCYLVMSGLIMSGLIKRGWTLIGLAAGLIGAWVLYQNFGSVIHVNTVKKVLDFIFLGRGPFLLPCFLLGAAAYTLRYQLPYDVRLFALAMVVALGLNFFGDGSWMKIAWLAFITCPMFMYLMLFIGMSKMPKIPYFSGGDYSYGIYLYAYPLQQTLVALFHIKSGLVMWISSVAVATLFATFSWHVIEKPILAMRKNFSFVARKEANHEAQPAGSPIDPVAPPIVAAPNELAS